MISILIVDDSPLTIAILRKAVETPKSGITVVATASNGKEALPLIETHRPDVIVTDLIMPVMDGLQLTREVMQRFPTPILVMSTALRHDPHEAVGFELLQAGAVDLFAKPSGNMSGFTPQQIQDLLRKIRVVAGVVVFSNRGKTYSNSDNKSLITAHHHPNKRLRLVAIGASTGGPQALLTLLRRLPHNYPLPILCIQHITATFTDQLISWLQRQIKLRIEIVTAPIPLRPATVYFAADYHHISVNSHFEAIAVSANSDTLHAPSINMAFSAVADHVGAESMGILLTGMGEDGAQGLLQMFHKGCDTVAEAEESCIVFGMPRKAIALGAAGTVLPLSAIAELLQQIGV